MKAEMLLACDTMHASSDDAMGNRKGLQDFEALKLGISLKAVLPIETQ
jgi:hypothetical protein